MEHCIVLLAVFFPSLLINPAHSPFAPCPNGGRFRSGASLTRSIRPSDSSTNRALPMLLPGIALVVPGTSLFPGRDGCRRGRGARVPE